MTAQSGALVLIKAGNGATPEVFSIIGGLRTSEMSINRHIMDTSNIESGAWQKLLDNAGIMSMQISGGGLFTNAASEDTLRGYALSGSTNNYKFIFANGSNITGAFMITMYHRSGSHDGEEHYSVSMESSGNIAYSSL